MQPYDSLRTRFDQRGRKEPLSTEMSDREWSAFMSSALGNSVSEEGALIGLNSQLHATTWVTPSAAKQD